MILIVDTAHENAAATLTSWFGRDGSAVVATARLTQNRYLVVLTIDTQGDPKYLHAIECVPDIQAVIAALQHIGEFPGAGELCSRKTTTAGLMETRTLLNDSDLAAVDAYLADATKTEGKA